ASSGRRHIRFDAAGERPGRSGDKKQREDQVEDRCSSGRARHGQCSAGSDEPALQSHHGKGDTWRSVVHGRKEGARKLMSLNLSRCIESRLTASALIGLTLLASCAAPPPPERPP